MEHEGECSCSLCGKKEHLEKDCPSQKQSPPIKKRKDMSQEQKDIKICICCESEGHTAEECPWKKETIPQNGGENGIRKEIYQDMICRHCRALDHSIEDCPSLKLADQRRRKIKCEKCGEIGHDIVDCLDESDIRIEREIKQAIDRKQKELNKINKKLQEIKKVRETKEPQDKDTNSIPEQKYTPPRKRTQAGRSSRDQDDQTPNKGSEPPKDMGQAGGVHQVIQEGQMTMDQMMKMIVMMMKKGMMRRILKGMRKKKQLVRLQMNLKYLKEYMILREGELIWKK